MNLYLAARYSRRAEVDALADRLTALGYGIVSTWHSQALEALDARIMEDDYADVARLHASVDLANIAHADTVLLLTDAGLPTRGGRHFECGVAYARGIPLVCVGQPEHIFHRLPGVALWPSVETWLTSQQEGICP